MPKRYRGTAQGRTSLVTRSRYAKPYMTFERGKNKKGVKNVIHSMKVSNQLQVINQNLQSTSVATTWQPDQTRTEDLTYGIMHESYGKELSIPSPGSNQQHIIETPEDLAKACSRRSGNEIYLMSLRFKYKFELNNDVLLNQYGEGLKMRMVLVVDKYEQGIPIGKDMFAFSNAYQKHKDAFSNELNHENMYSQGITPQAVNMGRDFGDDEYFFDRFEKINAGLNKKRYTVCIEWTFYFKRKYIGDEQIKRGTITYPFNNQKIKYWSSPKQEGSPNEYVTRPSKSYKLIMWYERMNGDDTKVSGKAPIKVKLHGDIYWKDAAPFDC